MASTFFIDRNKNLSATHAFELLTKRARAEHGTLKRSGTIAMKDKFQLVSDRIMSLDEAIALAKEIMNGRGGYQHINDCDGPAGAIQIGRLEWIFFGRSPN